MRLSQRGQIGLVLVWTLLTGYFIFKPSYKIKYYKLGFYPYTYLTEMIYWRLGDRELIYIYGKHERKAYPDKDYITRHDFAGFDEASSIIAVCDSNRRIAINFYDGLFDTPVQSKSIKARKVDIEEWVRLDTNQIGLRLEAY